MTMGSQAGSPPPHGGQSNSWWDQMAERRLTEIVANLQELTKDLRSQIRASDIQGSALQRLDERLRDAERALDTLPTKLERLASVEWMTRLDARLSVIEDEQKSPFVRKTEFAPVKTAVFVVIGCFCLTVLGAVAKLVIKQ